MTSATPRRRNNNIHYTAFRHREISMQKYEAFFGTPRDKMRQMRRVIRREHGVDIGNPVEQGSAYMKEVLGGKIVATWLDCCPQGCMAYTGTYAMLSTCEHCTEPRYDTNGKARSKWEYIPLIPRLRLQFQDPTRSRQLKTYRATFSPNAERTRRDDVFDGYWFRECYANGKFQDTRDLALRISLDGIGLVKNPRKNQSITPVVIYLLNLHPAVRDSHQNALTSLVIPGTFEEEYLDTWLEPLVVELSQLSRGIHRTLDGDAKKEFCMRAYPILVTGTRYSSYGYITNY